MTSISENEMNSIIQILYCPVFAWNIENFYGNLFEKYAFTKKKRFKLRGKTIVTLEIRNAVGKLLWGL